MQKNIVVGTVIGILAKVIGSVGAFVIIPLMLHKLGIKNYGIWMTISATMGLLGFMDFGTGDSLINSIAKNKLNQLALRRQIGLAYSIQLTVMLPFIFIFYWGFSYINWKSVFNIDSPSKDILNGIFITVVFFLVGLVANTIYAIQRGLENSVIANIWKLVSIVCSLGSLYLCLQFNPCIEWVAFATTGVPVLVASINTVWFLKRESLLPILFRVTFKEAWHFIYDSALFLYLQIVALLLFQTDTIIIAHYTSFNTVSQFSIIVKLFLVPTIFMNIYLSVLWPSYVKAAGNNNLFWMQKTFYRTLICSISGIILFLGVFFLYKNLFLTYWLKTDITISLEIYIAFAVWLITYAFEANIAIILSGLQLFKLQVWSSAITVIVNLSLSIMLVKIYGMIGVVWGTSIASFFCSMIPLMIYLKRFFKVNVKT